MCDPPPLLPPSPQTSLRRAGSPASLNSQESSTDVGKLTELTDRQQAEYRDAYREYITHIAQLEGPAGERPAHLAAPPAEDKGRDGDPGDGHKPLAKKGGKPSDEADPSCSSPTADDPSLLDPISEEDERPNHASDRSLLGLARAAERVGPKMMFLSPRYQKLASEDEESGAEESDRAPLLGPGSSTGTEGDVPHEKDPSESSPDPPARAEEEGPEPLIELNGDGPARMRARPPRSVSGLPDPAVARMSICSEAPSEGSLPASSPDESWPPPRGYNLNRTASNTTLNNNTNASTEGTPLIIAPGSARTLHNNNLKREGLTSGTAPVTSDSVNYEEERESIL